MVRLKHFAGLLLAPMLVFAASAAPAEEVGKVGVDWFGNDIVVDAVHDPKVKGVTCYLASFSRGMIDRLQKGNWFENPSNASISCEQTGPIVIGDIKLGKGGERVFAERTSLIWKNWSSPASTTRPIIRCFISPMPHRCRTVRPRLRFLPCRSIRVM